MEILNPYSSLQIILPLTKIVYSSPEQFQPTIYMLQPTGNSNTTTYIRICCNYAIYSCSDENKFAVTTFSVTTKREITTLAGKIYFIFYESALLAASIFPTCPRADSRNSRSCSKPSANFVSSQASPQTLYRARHRPFRKPLPLR